MLSSVIKHCRPAPALCHCVAQREARSPASTPPGGGVRRHRTKLKQQQGKWPPTKTRRLARARLWARTAPQTPRWRPPAAGDCAAQPRTGTRRAALLGPCARAAPLGAIRPRLRQNRTYTPSAHDPIPTFYKPPRTAIAKRLELLGPLFTLPSKKVTAHAECGLLAYEVENQ